MSYVGEPFAHDLFVSYSHGSDAEGEGLLRPWSTAFATELEKELRVDPRFRQSLSLFLDAKLRPGQGVDPMEGLTPQLTQQIAASALLLVLMSPDYVASEWCRRERDAWVAAQEALGLPTDGRVAVVRIWPTPEPWPTPLCDPQGVPLVGFPFHDDSLGADRPLGWADLGQSFGSDFRRALLSVVGRLGHHLDALRTQLGERRKAQEDAQRLQGPQGQSIYLHGRVDHRKAWEDAANALLSDGYSVVPGDPDPVEDDPRKLMQLRRARVETLADCDALLLLGTEDGRALDADLLAIGRYDRQSARARSHRLLPCCVLDTVGPPVATPVRRATARNLQTDWLDGTQPPWTPAVQHWLAAQGAAAAASE